MVASLTLSCRIHILENDLYLARRRLEAAMHEVECTIANLRDAVHMTICESGERPVHTLGRAVIDQVTETVAGLDLEPLRRRVEAVEEIFLSVQELQGERDTVAAAERRESEGDAQAAAPMQVGRPQ
jgi:hypothetical protein